MYSFIPSWYEGTGEWHAHITPWYQKAQSYEFDDTVNQLRMFRDAGEETELLCLAFFPNLRRFLHRQNLYPIAYWSVFDEMQNITLRTPAVFSYLELPWPEDVEWVYLPSRAVAIRREQTYADVEFTEDGTLCWVEYYEKGEAVRRDLYDDRGFCSSSVFFRDHEKLRQEYYDAQGKLRFTLNCTTGGVQVSENARGDFKRRFYPFPKEMIREKLEAFLMRHPDREAVVIAAEGDTKPADSSCRAQCAACCF